MNDEHSDLFSDLFTRIRDDWEALGLKEETNYQEHS